MITGVVCWDPAPTGEPEWDSGVLPASELARGSSPAAWVGVIMEDVRQQTDLGDKPRCHNYLGASGMVQPPERHPGAWHAARDTPGGVALASGSVQLPSTCQSDKESQYLGR